MKTRKKRPVKRYVTPAQCPFCKEGKEPDYKEYNLLKKYLTARSSILAKKYSGVCSYHQRLLSREIKRARNLALLPFMPNS